MVQGLLAFAFAALLALVAVSGSQDRSPLPVTSDMVLLQTVTPDRSVH